MSETVNAVKDEIPAHPNFITLGEFADLREGAPDLPKNIGSSVVFLANENGTYKILNGRILGITIEKYGMEYAIMKRNGNIVSHVNHVHVIAV